MFPVQLRPILIPMLRPEPIRSVESLLVEVCTELSPATVRTRPRHVNALLRVSMMSGMQMNLTATLQVLLEQVREITPFEKALVYFWERGEERTLLRTAIGVGPGERERLIDQNIVDRWMGQHGKPIVFSPGDHPEADAVLAAVGAESCLAVPVLVSNRVMGSVQLFASRPGAFSPEDAQMMWLLARVAESLLTREYSNEGLMHFAFTDHLTGLRSRGYFEQQLEMEIKRAQRNGEQFALLMLDIDHFKRLNDTFGHHLGDKTLRRVAAALTEDMREVDTVARYGGEEFVIILPDTTAAEAHAVAQRIRLAVEQTGVPVGSGVTETITISIGLAVFDADAATKSGLMRNADRALYQAKAAGRNRVVMASQLHPEQQQAS